jgi:hypothetical protein
MTGFCAKINLTKIYKNIEYILTALMRFNQKGSNHHSISIRWIKKRTETGRKDILGIFSNGIKCGWQCRATSRLHFAYVTNAAVHLKYINS